MYTRRTTMCTLPGRSIFSISYNRRTALYLPRERKINVDIRTRYLPVDTNCRVLHGWYDRMILLAYLCIGV